MVFGCDTFLDNKVLGITDAYYFIFSVAIPAENEEDEREEEEANPGQCNIELVPLNKLFGKQHLLWTIFALKNWYPPSMSTFQPYYILSCGCSCVSVINVVGIFIIKQKRKRWRLCKRVKWSLVSRIF